MDGYGVLVSTLGRGSARYRINDGEIDTWDDILDAEAIAYSLLGSSGRVVYVSFGNGEHEFRRWADDVTEHHNFDHPGIRWAEWYVDVEINGHRWRYRPVADLDDQEAADGIADLASELRPDITRMWVGRSDGSEEYESEVFED